MNIGITMKLNKGMNIFGNGLGQNCLALYDTFKKISYVDNVYIVYFEKRLKDEEFQNLKFLDGYDVVHWNDNEVQNIDLLTIVGTHPTSEVLTNWKNKDINRRCIIYKGGNAMALLTEDIIFERKWVDKDEEKLWKGTSIRLDGIDEIWMVPQQEFHNKQFHEITYGVEAKSVPFVWTPKFIEQEYLQKKTLVPELEIEFDNREFNGWKVISMEPNTSVLKNMVPILFAIEDAYKKQPDLFEQFNITNAKDFITNELLIAVASDLEIQKNNKLVFDRRWTVSTLISIVGNFVVSHQWGNPLNYAYLDVLYYGYPLVHNAHLCKDIGYYYEDYKLRDAADLMIKAASERREDKHYMKRHRNILKRYMSDHNENMVNQYGDLIKSLWDGPRVEGEWNWKTNLIE